MEPPGPSPVRAESWLPLQSKGGWWVGRREESRLYSEGREWIELQTNRSEERGNSLT